MLSFIASLAIYAEYCGTYRIYLELKYLKDTSVTLGSYSTFINLYNTTKSSSINIITSVGMQQCTEITSFPMIAMRSLLSAFSKYSSNSWLS